MINVLLVNDDGVHAPGINILFNELKEICNVTMVAPLSERSTTGHSLTLDHTLRLERIEENKFGCSGFPADCALMGIGFIFKKLYKGKKIDLVVSGINRGANLGQDIYYSGTVAAAREASFHGIPSIAVSSCMDFKKIPNDIDHYISASKLIKRLIQLDVVNYIPPMTLLNINVPWKSESEIKGIKITDIGFRKYSEDIDEREDFRGRKYYWIGGIYRGFDEFETSDCYAVEESNVSITPLKLYGHGILQNDFNNKVAELINKYNEF